jgi:hypothetical protein
MMKVAASDITKWLRRSIGKNNNLIHISDPKRRLIAFVDIDSPDYDHVLFNISDAINNKELYKIFEKCRIRKGVMYSERGMMFADWVEKILYNEIFST